MKHTAAIVAVAGLASVAIAQPLNLIARTFENPGPDDTTLIQPFDDVNAFTSATTLFRIGNQPVSIAFDGESLYIGGNVNGPAFAEIPPDSGNFVELTLGIAEISGFLTDTPGAINVPGSRVPATSIRANSGEGFTGMDWDDRFGLISALDRGSANPSDQGNPDAPFAQFLNFQRDDPSDFSLSLQGFATGIRGNSGAAYDHGFDGNGFLLSDATNGPAAGLIEFGQGVMWGFDPTAADSGTLEYPFGTEIYTPLDMPNVLYNIFVGGTGPEAAWRDIDIHPDNGLIVARSNNLAVVAERTPFNGTTTSPVILTPPGGKQFFTLAQNIEIIHNTACGDYIILNDRPNSGQFSAFSNTVFIYDPQGNVIEFNLAFEDGTPLDPDIDADLSNIWSFFWHEDDQMLFLADGINRRVFAIDLFCPCEADLNRDGDRDFADLILYQTRANNNAPVADIDGMPGVGAGDVNQFLSNLASGCP